MNGDDRQSEPDRPNGLDGRDRPDRLYLQLVGEKFSDWEHFSHGDVDRSVFFGVVLSRLGGAEAPGPTIALSFIFFGMLLHAGEAHFSIEGKDSWYEVDVKQFRHGTLLGPGRRGPHASLR